MAFSFLPAAQSWLLAGCGQSMLVLADSLALPRGLVRLGYHVVTVDRDMTKLRSAVDSMSIGAAVAHADALPFDYGRFDAVFVHQVFPDIKPDTALPEFARVLKPGGRLLISHLGRDDSVPWVQRLAALVRTVDPTAMTSPSVDEALAGVDDSKFFTQIESRNFRYWQPISQQGLAAMVSAVPAVAALDDRHRQHLLDEATAIHDQAAGYQQLRLPYLLRCWRGVVDSDSITNPIRRETSALSIQL